MERQTHTCSAGETFDSIALRIYKDEKYACDLLAANPTLCHVMQFSGGEILTLPVIEVPENEGNAPLTAPWKAG